MLETAKKPESKLLGYSKFLRVYRDNKQNQG